MTLTPDSIRQMASEDFWFKKQPEGVQVALLMFVAELPKILDNMLNKDGTLVNILRAKAAFVDFCLKNNFHISLGSVMTSGLVLTKGDIETVLWDKLARAHKKLLKWALDLERSRDINDKQLEILQVAKKIGMEANTYQLYYLKIPTIAELLEVQPLLFVNLDIELPI